MLKLKTGHTDPWPNPTKIADPVPSLLCTAITDTCGHINTSDWQIKKLTRNGETQKNEQWHTSTVLGYETTQHENTPHCYLFNTHTVISHSLRKCQLPEYDNARLAAACGCNLQYKRYLLCQKGIATKAEYFKYSTISLPPVTPTPIWSWSVEWKAIYNLYQTRAVAWKCKTRVWSTGSTCSISCRTLSAAAGLAKIYEQILPSAQSELMNIWTSFVWLRVKWVRRFHKTFIPSNNCNFCST